MIPSFNNSPIKAHLTHYGSFGGVVKACYETCEEPIASVTYARVGSDFVITSYTIHPLPPTKEAIRAGNNINRALEAEAHKLGIRRLLMVLPHQDTAEVIEEYQVQPFLMGLDNKQPNVYVN